MNNNGVTTEFFTFILSSLSSALVDYLLFCLLYYVLVSESITWTLPVIGTCHPHLFLSVFIARVCSSFWNFMVNRYIVFRVSKQERQSLGRSLAGYYLLCVIVFIGSWLLTAWVTKFIAAAYGKLIVDTFLFVLCFLAQKYCIFRRKTC